MKGLKYYFFRLSSRLLLNSFHDLAVSGKLILATDFNYIFHIYINNLKPTNTTFVNRRGAFICFILCYVILSLNFCFDKIALGLLSVTGLVAASFRSFMKVSQSLSYFGIFVANKEEGVWHNFLSGSYQRQKIDQSNDQMWTHKALVCYAYNIVFLTFSYIFKMFLLAMLAKLTIALLE